MTRDHEEVCPLARGVMLHPLSTRLQDGIRFFPTPLPAPPWADLAACCPRGSDTGLPRSACQACRYRCLLLTGGRVDHGSLSTRSYTHPHYRFWLKRVSHFRFFTYDDLYRRFKYFHHADYLALIRLMAARKVRLSRFAPHTLRCFVTLSGPLLIQARRFIR